MTLENVDMFIDKFNKIKKMYERDFEKTFDSDNDFNNKMKQISTEKFIHELNTQFDVSIFKKLYDIGELQLLLLYETMCKYIQTIDIGILYNSLIIFHIVTNHDLDFMFFVICVYFITDILLFVYIF